jgi:DAK2 domain fusion protein YloV
VSAEGAAGPGPDLGEALDAAQVRRWCRVGLAELGRAREEIDAMNVFPVADGDTGTNLFLTMEAATEAVEVLLEGASAGECVRALVRGALVGARGNSGVILSQMLKGAADVVLAILDPSVGASGAAARAAGPPTAEVAAGAFARAAALAYAAVARPVEGTMLTVARAGADAAAGLATAGDDLAHVVGGAAAAAREALVRTPLQLEALARAGVVDAGGRGLTVLYDALAAVVSGLTPMSPPPRAHIPVREVQAGGCADAGGPSFEVMYLLDADEAGVTRLRAELAARGDSLVVVGGEGLWNVHVHVHVDDVGPALEAGLRAGRPHGIRVSGLDGAPAGRAAAQRGTAARAVLALAPGPGLAGLLADAGAVVVENLSGRRPSTSTLLESIRGTRAGEVVLLPNDRDGRAACEAAAEQARGLGVRAAVIPTVASVQALAALAVHEAGRRFDDDVVAMTSAAGATRHGEILVAGADAITTAGVCRAGDVLGLIDGDVVTIGRDPETIAFELVGRLLRGGGELVTLIGGVGAAPGMVARLESTLRRERPEVDCVAYEGGQHEHPLLIGVE